MALLDSMLADGEDQEAGETWRVWINAYGEAVRLPELRHTIESRLNSWYALLDDALEGRAGASRGRDPVELAPGRAAQRPGDPRADLRDGADREQIRDEVLAHAAARGSGRA